MLQHENPQEPPKANQFSFDHFFCSLVLSQARSTVNQFLAHFEIERIRNMFYDLRLIDFQHLLTCFQPLYDLGSNFINPARFKANLEGIFNFIFQRRIFFRQKACYVLMEIRKLQKSVNELKSLVTQSFHIIHLHTVGNSGSHLCI